MLYVCHVAVRWFHGFSGTGDHGEFQQDVTLSATNNRHCANISIIEDTLPEENELFQITVTNIRRVQYNFYPYQVHTSVATITILDDDSEFDKMSVLMYYRRQGHYTRTCSLQLHVIDHV